MKFKLMIIAITLLFTGCDTCIICNDDEVQIYDYELIVDLEQDTNGYYILPMINASNNQVLHKFTLDTNNPEPNQFVWWDCDTQYEMNILDNHSEWIDIINHASYTGYNEEAYTMFGPFVELTGDTVMVYVGYVDSEYGIEYSTTFSVILQGAQ